MKKILLSLAVLTIVALGGFVQTANAAEENLVVNGSFDDDLVGWRNATPYESVRIIEENNNKFARHFQTDGGYITDQTVTGLEPNGQYRLTADSRCSTYPGSPSGVKAYFGLRTKEEYMTSAVSKSVFFTTQNVVLKASDEGILNVFFAMEPNGLNPTMFGQSDFDNFILKKVSE